MESSVFLRIHWDNPVTRRIIEIHKKRVQRAFFFALLCDFHSNVPGVGWTIALTRRYDFSLSIFFSTALLLSCVVLLFLSPFARPPPLCGTNSGKEWTRRAWSVRVNKREEKNVGHLEVKAELKRAGDCVMQWSARFQLFANLWPSKNYVCWLWEHFWVFERDVIARSVSADRQDDPVGCQSCIA